MTIALPKQRTGRPEGASLLAYANLSAALKSLPQDDPKLDDFHDAVSEAEERLNEIEPTTMAGIRKKLSGYVADYEARGDEWTDARGIHRSIANALERLTDCAAA